MLQFTHCSCGYADVEILRDIELSIEPGRITGLIGVNGSGKTTLLKTAARLLAPRGGAVLLNGRDIRGFKRTEFARHVSFLPQNRPVPEITVELLTSHGRFPHLGFSHTLTRADRDAVEIALRQAGMEAYRGRSVAQLSGGERQRAYLAMLLAQDTELLLLDEPTAFLDIRQQFSLLQLLRELTGHGKTIVIVLHELALAMKFCDRIAVLHDASIAGYGSPEDLWSDGVVSRVFGVGAQRVDTPHGPDYLFFPQPDGAPRSSGR